MRQFARDAIDIARGYLEIAALLPTAGYGLVGFAACLNVLLGLLPVAFIVATSIMIGRVPAAVAAGVGSAEWRDLVLAFVVAAAAFLVQQIIAPLQVALGELVARRVTPLCAARASGRWRTSACSTT
jgi:ATP-binding cassette subfamily B protein